jgi:prolyl-tRNA synthetase
VVRWELRPRIFLRTTEFLWQEGHTAHATEADARDYALRILHEVYRDFMVEVLGIPVFVGRKTARERFAGATNTLTCEAMMGDGKALQMGTSHELGQNFAKVFGMDFLDAAGELQLAWTTSWGVSTRMIGGLIMAHGDDDGLRLPPRLAPIQVMVMVVRDDEECHERARLMAEEMRLAGMRVELDDRVETSFGRRSTEWELKGVPVRVEVGPRDLAAGVVTVVRRDLPNDAADRKVVTGVVEMAAAVSSALDAAQWSLHDQAVRRVAEGVAEVESIADAVEAGSTGFARIRWDLVGEAGEDALAEHSISVRCLQRPDGSVPESDAEPDLVALVARSY